MTSVELAESLMPFASETLKASLRSTMLTSRLLAEIRLDNTPEGQALVDATEAKRVALLNAHLAYLEKNGLPRPGCAGISVG